MRYFIEPDADEKFGITIADAPEYIRGLVMAPDRREPELDDGDWLVLAFAVWSINDRTAIDDAINVAEDFEGRYRLGIRPFETANEFQTWLTTQPDNPVDTISEDSSNGKVSVRITGTGERTPVWIWLRNGTVTAEHQGLLQPQGIRDFAEECLGGDSQEAR